MSYGGDGHYRPQASATQQYAPNDHIWAHTPPRTASQHSQQQQAPPAILPSTVTLSMRQQPAQALATADGKEKTRKPIDPPPIVKMDVDDRADPNRLYLFSPHLFVMAALIPEGQDQTTSRSQKGIIGETCSAIHRLKDLDNKEGGYFVFGDISIRKPGRYRLQFSLFNSDSPQTYTLVAEIFSNTFSVYSSKDFHGMDESTVVSRHFNEQGVRLRMRKEPRSRQVAVYAPELESDTTDPRHHLHNDYSQLSHQRYTPQAMYQTDDRGMKRRRDDENELRPTQMPRTTYYQNPYQAPGSAPQYTTMALPSHTYPVQHMLPQSIHQPTLSHHYLNSMGNLDPEIFK